MDFPLWFYTAPSSFWITVGLHLLKYVLSHGCWSHSDCCRNTHGLDQSPVNSCSAGAEESFKGGLMLTLEHARSWWGQRGVRTPQSSSIPHAVGSFGERLLFFTNMYGCQETQSSLHWAVPSNAEHQPGLLLVWFPICAPLPPGESWIPP